MNFPALPNLDDVRHLVADGALFVLNDSGGKDSQATRLALRVLVPAAQRVNVHASLGDVEWPGALEHAQAGAERDGVPFIVARAGKTFLGMVEHRHATRPDAPCWPSSQYRQCTSDLKRGPIEREVRRYMKAHGFSTVVNCMGIRAQESRDRAKLVSFRRNEGNCLADRPAVPAEGRRPARPFKRGRDWFDWLPIFAYSRDDVFALIRDCGELPHYAYMLGNERLSCLFCIMGSRNDIRNAATYAPEIFKRYDELERRTGYTMHESRVPLRVLAGIEEPAR